jgi:hypothetical protein
MHIYESGLASVFVYLAIALALLSIFIKKLTFNLKVISGMLLLIYLSLFLYVLYLASLLPKVWPERPIFPLFGFYIYTLSTILIWISIILMKIKKVG